MTTYFDVFNIKTDMQLNNIMNNLDLSANEIFQLDDIVNDFSSLKEKREKILEMFSGTNNYNYCCKLFLKEDMEAPSQLNMNQTIELNELFELASEKFKKVNCSQQFYQLLSQKTSKNFANAFFNMLKSIPEDSNCRFDPNLEIDGKNFAETIYPFVNELKTFLNGCKSESKKEEVKENYEIGNKVQGKGKNQGTYIIDSIKNGFYNLRHIYSNDRNKLYPVSKKTLDEEFKLIKESIETQPDMFGGRDTYYKDGIEALDFDNVLDAMNKVAPEMDFVDDKDVKGKYSMIFQPKSSGLELNQKRLKKIKDYLSQRFGKENISVRLAHSQYAPEIKKLYVTFINQIDVQNELNESLEDTLNNFKYFITSSSNKKELNMMKDKLEILFNGSNDTELRNTISELLSMINSKLNTIKPSIDECCELGNLLEPFKTTVVNITVNDEGCLEDVEKESATNNLKALASHINDKKDCCEENNIENMQTIMSLISSLASFFQKRLCESQSYEKYNDVKEELNDIKQDYLNNELDVYDATNEVDNLIGNKSEAEAIVNSWDDPAKHGLYGITDDEEIDEDKSKLPILHRLMDKCWYDSYDGKDAKIGNWEIGLGGYDTGYEFSYNNTPIFRISPNHEIEFYGNENISGYSKEDIFNTLKSYPDLKNLKMYDEDEELDEDTVYDHSWYEVKGQKYPKRTKNGVEIKESENSKTKFKTCLFHSLSKPTIWYAGINGKIIPESPEFTGTWGKEKAQKWIDNWLKEHGFESENDKELDEMCSGGATCAASVATVPSSVKTKSPKRKYKKSKVDEMALNMFKRHIIEDVNSQIDANGNHYEYRDGYFYINGDIARTKSKYQMLESLDENIELETLPGFNSEEMKLLEDIEASGNVGNEDDNNQNNNSNNNNNADNNNNQQNTNQNINQDNLGDVEQNVTQDNDLTPQQRQLKKDTEQVLDQSMNSGSDTEVSVNQGMDNNNDQATNTQTSSNNVKYKVIGKDDSDSNNIKYIIQDPNSKETMVVDATKLRLEK